MLLLVAAAFAGTWPICASTESSATANGGWRLVDSRESDSDDDVSRGSWESSASVSMEFGGKSDSAACGDMGGALGRWSSDMLSVASLPGQSAQSCTVSVWAEGHADASGRSRVDDTRIAAMARGDSVSDADAENSGEMSVDGGGGARFVGEWAWRLAGSPTAEVVGSITVGAAAAYAGAMLEVPGWAMVDAWEGEVDAWVRRGDEWVHVTGTAPMEIPFGAVVPARGAVCASGSAMAGSHASEGEGGVGASAIAFEMEPVKTAAPVDVTPEDGPEFAPCACGS